MDRAYDSHSKKFLVKETIPKTERLTRGKPSINKETNNKDCSRDNDQGKTFSTHPLDEAMQELLDICHQYNDKLSNHKKQNQQSGKVPVCEGEDKLTSSMPADRPNVATNQEKEDSKIICDRKVEMKKKDQFSPDECLLQHAIQQGNLVHHHQHSRQVGAVAAPEPIERLQEKQAELQRQLDEVQLVARKLASRRKRNLTDILEDREDIEIQDNTNKDEYRRSFVEEEEEDDELIEFQQIENELRISDLKRQLDNIQEELRIRLFKRLVSNTGAKQMQSRSPASSNSIENCSPSSSSCSDTPISSTLNNGPNALAVGLLESPSTHQREKEVSAATDGSAVKTSKPDSSLVRSQDIYGSAEANEEFYSASYKQSINQTSTHAKNHIRSNCSDLDSAVDYTEALTPTTSKESVMSKKNISVETATVNNLAKDTISPYQAMSPYVHNTSPVHPINLRNNSANSDLERIEEDEDEQEEQEDYYCNSDKFRTIYEEKLSPKALGHVTADSRSIQLPRNQTSLEENHDQYSRLPSSGDAIELISSQQRSNSSQNPTQLDGCVKLEKRSDREAFNNRPLTLYLPKPDEEIDLVEHVQRLGHDTSIISDDLKLSSKSAQGYLWKCCAKNTNKWLRRYFYYDRESKIVAYFKSEHQLTKKHPSPRDTIPFEEISDVYVNHQLSSLDDKGNRASKGRNFVFVLATIGRKYLLATSKAETMRAWIDILFTAAKANDYLEHMEDEDELNDANSDSFR